MTDERNNAGELTVRLVRADEVAWYNALMKEHHSLGAAASGRVLRYVAEAAGEPLVLGTFGSAAWRVPVRDRHIGWDDGQRAARLERVCANQRLCVLPAAAQAVRHAASRALAAMLRALPADYLSAFGVRLMAAESFTDPAAHAGTVYAACGFTPAGLTAGYGRSRGRDYYAYHGQPKQLWLRELAPGGIAALAAGFDAPVLAGRRAPDFNRLRVSGSAACWSTWPASPTTASPKGSGMTWPRSWWWSWSPGCAARTLSMPPPSSRSRCRRKRCAAAGSGTTPGSAGTSRRSHTTIKRTIRKIDAEAADQQMCAWLRAEAAAGRLTGGIAFVGKTVRGAVRPDGTRPHLLAAFDVTAATVLARPTSKPKPTRSPASPAPASQSSTAATAGPVAAATTRLAAATATGHRRETPQEEQEEEEEEKKKKSWSS